MYIDEINDVFNNSFNNSFTNSWADLVNNEMSNNIIDKQMTVIENGENKKETHLNVGEIMSLDISQLTEIQLMEYQNYITSQLRKYFKQCSDKGEEIDYDLHLSKVFWIGEVSKYFSNKYNLKLTAHRVKMISELNSIPRSSYKFCEYGNECTYNYNNGKEKCNSQHFVHNLIYADIMSLYQYLLIGQMIKKKLNMVDIIKSINTISYVINHMYEELYLLSLYNPNKTMQIKTKIINKNNKNNKKNNYN